MIKLNNVTYGIISKEVTITPSEDGLVLCLSAVGQNKNIDPDIGEISIELTTNIEDFDDVQQDVDGLFFVTEFLSGKGTLEIIDDYIHYYGHVDVNYNNKLGKDVEFDVVIRR